jgi:predicted MPP superfamily phosphohydrolase
MYDIELAAGDSVRPGELVLQPEAVSSRRPWRFLTHAALSVLIGGVGGYAFGVEPHDLRVVRQDIEVAGWQREASGLRIGHLSDLHCESERARRRTARAAALLADQKPDVVVLTGDYVTSSASQWAGACADALAPLAKAPLGAYAILGNHDWYSGEPGRVECELGRVGFKVLRNASLSLPDVPGVWMVGLDDRWKRKHDLPLAMTDVPADAQKILLVHEPDYADEAGAGFAVQFSGHSHGGQVRFPGLGPLYTPKLSRHYFDGLQQSLYHPVYTTRGVGTCGFPMRLFCRPEVAVLTLVSAG